MTAPTLIGTSNDQVSASSKVITTTAAQAGDHLILAVAHSRSSSSGSSVTDSKGNTWQLDKRITNQAGHSMVLYSCKAATKLASGDTVTVNFGGSAAAHSAMLYDAPGLDTTTWFDHAVAGISNFTNDFNGTGPVITDRDSTVMVFESGETSTTAITYTDHGTPTRLNTNAAGTTGRRFSMVALCKETTGHENAEYANEVSIGCYQAAIAGVYRKASASAVKTWRRAILGLTEDPATSVVISVRTENATAVRVKLATNSGLSAGVQYSASASPSTGGWTKHTFTGLTPGQQYYYGVEMDTSTLSTALTTDALGGGGFKTLDHNAPYSVLFGSCLDSANVDAGVWRRMRAYAQASPAFFAHLGDFVYSNITTNDQSLFRAAFDDQLRDNGNLHRLVMSVPTVYIPSDHDSGNDNWTGGPGTQTPAYQAVYREVFPTSTLPVSDGVYHAVVVGNHRHIFTDGRSFKSPKANTDNSSKTLLGTGQKSWLKSQLMEPEALKVIYFDVPWTEATTAGSDTWGGYNTERTEIADFITKNKLNVHILHGDQHSAAYDDGTNSAGGIPVACGSPFEKDATLKGTYSGGNYPTTAGGTARQYGRWSAGDFFAVDGGGTTRKDTTLPGINARSLPAFTVSNPPLGFRPVVPAGGADYTVNLNAGIFMLRPVGDFNDGDQLVIHFVQDATGSRVVAFPDTSIWSLDDAAYDPLSGVSLTASATTTLTFEYDAGLDLWAGI